ncbi:MAG: polysaccharide pyruvyl transferase family protein [Hyphomicrobium sp.]|uniref:polysaccharide pyruvyl transferase family protein n=1 Tax=Hyphomicrobium sp. TaxID=82 RepID=UPI003D13FA36
MTGRPLRALVSDASLSGHHGSALVTSQACRLAADAGIDATSGWTGDALWDAVESGRVDFDLVIVNGEGSLHSNSRAAERTATIAADLAQQSLPAYLINATVEGNRLQLDKALGLFRLRFVRDSRSQAQLERAHVEAEVVHDLTLTAAHLPKAEGRGPLLITDASDQAKTRRLLALAARWPDAEAITLRTRPPWPRRGAVSRRVSFEVKRQLARLLPLSPWSLRYGRAVAFVQLVDRLAHHARGIVCGRYHAVCLALRMGLPFVAIEGNTSKTGALLADIGLVDRCVPLAELEASDSAFPIAPFTEVERQRIEAFLTATERAAAAMFRRIAEDARRRHGVTGHPAA